MIKIKYIMIKIKYKNQFLVSSALGYQVLRSCACATRPCANHARLIIKPSTDTRQRTSCKLDGLLSIGFPLLTFYVIDIIIELNPFVEKK